MIRWCILLLDRELAVDLYSREPATFSSKRAARRALEESFWGRGLGSYVVKVLVIGNTYYVITTAVRLSWRREHWATMPLLTQGEDRELVASALAWCSTHKVSPIKNDNNVPWIREKLHAPQL